MVDVHAHMSTNDTAGALAAAAGGLGINSTTSWACKLELERGALVRTFPDWETAALPVHVYYPTGRATRIAARALVEFLSVDLVRDPPARSKVASSPRRPIPRIVRHAITQV